MTRAHKPFLATGNFVTPDNPYGGLLKTVQRLVLPAIAVLLVAAAGYDHYRLMTQHASLEQRRAVAEDAANMPTDALEQYEEALAAEEAARTRLDALHEALPEQPDWRQIITIVTEKLPGIQTGIPTVTLQTLRMTTRPDLEAHRFDPTPQRPIRIEVALSGTAQDKNAVTNAVLAYEADSSLATSFTGTTSQGDAFSFDLTLALLEPRGEDQP